MQLTAQDQQIIHFLPKLDIEEKVFVLNQIKSLIDKKAPTTGKQTLEQYNNEIKVAEARIDGGSYYTHEEVEELAKKW